MTVVREAEPATPRASFASDYFRRVERSYALACQARAQVERAFIIAGLRVRLCAAGTALLARLTPALEHLATESGGAPDLTIAMWDGATTGVPLPSLPWSPEDYGPRGEIRESGRFRVVVDAGAGALSMLDVDRNLALFSARDADELPYWESGAPFRIILHWWMTQRGLQFVHAGAIGTPSGGILLAGKGGSGKSTTSLACLAAGLGYAGDDYCIVSLRPQPTVHSLYSTAKLNPDSVARFPALGPALSNGSRLDEEKGLYFLGRHLPDRILAGFPLRAVLLPRVTGARDTRLVPVSAAAALLALAPSTLFQLAHSAPEEFRLITRVLQAIPCYLLELGSDLDGVAGAVRTAVTGAPPG